MARITLNADKLKAQVAEQKEYLESIRMIDLKNLNQKEAPKKWSAVETVEHIYLTMHIYTPKFERYVPSLPSINRNQKEWRSRRTSGFFIESIGPKGDEIKYKMSTSKLFKPERAENGVARDMMNKIFDDTQHLLDEIDEFIDLMQTKDTSKLKINSALGALVRFKIPEAIAFILNHNARHIVQIQRILSKISA